MAATRLIRSSFRSLFNSLYGKLTLSLLGLVMLLGIPVLWVANYTSDMYSKEVTQRLNQNIAMYITDQQTLIDKTGSVNQAAIDELALRVMTINPTVEVYLTDPQGVILDHMIPAHELQREKISLDPVQQFLNGDVSFPIVGDDPREKDGQKVFSVWPVLEDGSTRGFLYAVLGGKKHTSLTAALQESLILKTGLIGITASLILVVVFGMGVFFVLTRRLTRLRKQIELFEADDSTGLMNLPKVQGVNDEIDHLSSSFYQMASRIREQFDALQTLDATRRELLANVSHDLRTPLSSMQGYLETLMIKESELPELSRRRYLETAYKHTQRLSSLVSELFELAKLDSGAVQPRLETFSLMELVYDCVQDYELIAAENGISFQIEPRDENCFVYADIALIQRVLQNLLDNAIRHSSSRGSIMVSVKNSEHRALIEVSDEGIGIAQHEIPHLFERFYNVGRSSDHKGTGLGLAIVKRILDLHESTIEVSSEPGKGARFVFDLPLPNVA